MKLTTLPNLLPRYGVCLYRDDLGYRWFRARKRWQISKQCPALWCTEVEAYDRSIHERRNGYPKAHVVKFVLHFDEKYFSGV